MRSTSACAFVAAQSAIKRKFEILALANFFEGLVAHLLKSAMDGLALRVRTLFLSETYT